MKAWRFLTCVCAWPEDNLAVKFQCHMNDAKCIVQLCRRRLERSLRPGSKGGNYWLVSHMSQQHFPHHWQVFLQVCAWWLFRVSLQIDLIHMRADMELESTWPSALVKKCVRSMRAWGFLTCVCAWPEGNLAVKFQCHMNDAKCIVQLCRRRLERSLRPGSKGGNYSMDLFLTCPSSIFHTIDKCFCVLVCFFVSVPID